MKLLHLQSRTTNCIIKMDDIAIVRFDDSNELGADDRVVLLFHTLDESAPALEYNVTKLSVPRRMQIMDLIAAHMISSPDRPVDKLVLRIDMDQVTVTEFV